MSQIIIKWATLRRLPWFPRTLLHFPSLPLCSAMQGAVWQVFGTVKLGGASLQWGAQLFARKWENNVKASVKNCAAYTAKVNLKSG